MSEETAFLTISLPAELKENVEEQARRQDRSVSAFTRIALTKEIERLEADAAKRQAKQLVSNS